MSACRSSPYVVALALLSAGLKPAGAAPQGADPLKPATRQAADLIGTWKLAVDKTGQSCQLLLRPQTYGSKTDPKSGEGDHVLGLLPACRHAMPDLANVNRWALPDPSHLALNDKTGAASIVFAAAGDRFTATLGANTYTLTPVTASRPPSPGFAAVESMSAPGFAAIVPVSKRARAATASIETPTDLGGRYAVMREKRDTGCMVTLDDKSRVKGGARAQLAPGCRDQGIVIFDPTAWAIVGGQLVLTARAGHKAHLQKAGEGSWEKDPKDGGKPLGLKKL